jgi:hypothetical protein
VRLRSAASYIERPSLLPGGLLYARSVKLQHVRRAAADSRAKLPRGCAICGGTKGIVVDHDNYTECVRGILCGCCNRGLGNFAHNPDRLRSAAAYLDWCAQLVADSGLTAERAAAKRGAIKHKFATNPTFPALLAHVRRDWPFDDIDYDNLRLPIAMVEIPKGRWKPWQLAEQFLIAYGIPRNLRPSRSSRG